MKAYVYDEVTREYLFEQDRQPSPLEAGVFFEVTNSTGKTPPECTEKEIQVWNGTDWEIKPDYRYTKVWKTVDATQSQITEIGKTLGTEYTDIEPSVAFPKWDKTVWIVDTIKKAESDLRKQVDEAKAYLTSTDFKVLPDYDRPNDDIKVLRQQARDFIRTNE